MPLHQFKNKIHDLIGNDQIPKAYSMMREEIHPAFDQYAEIVIAMSNFNFHHKEYYAGRIVISEYSMARNKANMHILDICSQLTDVDLLSYNNTYSIDIEVLQTKKSVQNGQKEPHIETNATNIEGKRVLSVKQQVHYHIQNAKKLSTACLFADAITELKKALELMPDDVKIKTDLAKLLRHANQHQEAIGILRAILENTPYDEHSRNELAVCYREIDELEKAIDVLNEGLSLVKNNNHFHTNLFQIHIFFTCNVQKALEISDKYHLLTKTALIRDEPVREKYMDFIKYFDHIQNGQANHEIMGHYLDECIHKRKAFKTAATVLGRLLKANPQSFWYKNACQNIPPQYHSLFN